MNEQPTTETGSPSFLALDLEFNQPSRKIIQVGIAIGRAGQPEQGFTRRAWLIDPKEPIAPEIVQLTGITDDDIRAHAVSEAQCASELSALINEHGAFVNPVTWGGGDSGALLELFRQHGLHFPHFGRRWIDVKTWAGLLALARPGKPASLSGGLKSIMGRYQLQFLGVQHRADEDAFNTLRLFFRLIERQQRLEAAAAMFRAI